MLLSFLLLASVPALLLTLIATGRISGALDRLQNPGVEASLSHSATLSRELVDRLRANAERLLEEIPRFPPPVGEEDAIVSRLERAGFDFAAYELSTGATRIVASAASAEHPAGGPSREDWVQLARGTAPEIRDGAFLRFFERARGPAEFGRAVGVAIEPETAEALDSAGDDYAKYLQLRLFEEIQKKMVWFTSAGIFLLTAGAAYVAARVTARRISRPVEDLAHAADRIAAGDLSHRATAQGDGEIAELVTAFNRMSGELERSRDELVRVERIAAWRDVARRIAHEIRNPLTPIKLAIHRLSSRLPDDAAARECLHSIGEEVDNLHRISESFSEFARMPEPRFAPTDLAQVVLSVKELYGDGSSGVEVRYEGPDALPLVADRDHLRRAVTNLLKNATEALGERGTITLRLSREANRAVLAVEDDGPGIPREIRESLFRPGVSGKPGGSGLGLAMVQRIATDHRGGLHWKDRDPGTSFVLEISLDLSETA